MCMSFFSHQAEVLCNSALQQSPHSLCVVSHFFQATKTNHGKWVKCDKSCANLWKNQSTLWAKRAAAVRKLRMAGTAKMSTFHCQRYCQFAVWTECTPNVKLKKILEEPAINSKSVAPRVFTPKKIVFHSKKAMMSVGQVMISAWKKHVFQAFRKRLGFPRNLPLHTLDGLASTSAPWAWMFSPTFGQRFHRWIRWNDLWPLRMLLCRPQWWKVELWSMKPFSKTQ